MAAPDESILVIATDNLGGDGFVSKVAPVSPVTNEGYGKQSLNYQQLNYLFNNQAQWLKYINEEQIPTVEEGLQDHVNATDNPHTVTKTQVGLSDVDNYSNSDDYTLDSSTSYATSKAVNDGRVNLQDQIDTINNDTIPAISSLTAIDLSDKITGAVWSPLEVVGNVHAISTFKRDIQGSVTLMGTFDIFYKDDPVNIDFSDYINTIYAINVTRITLGTNFAMGCSYSGTSLTIDRSNGIDNNSPFSFTIEGA